jgi:hypothetical protein
MTIIDVADKTIAAVVAMIHPFTFNVKLLPEFAQQGFQFLITI